jgi:hypothetical protein
MGIAEPMSSTHQADLRWRVAAPSSISAAPSARWPTRSSRGAGARMTSMSGTLRDVSRRTARVDAAGVQPDDAPRRGRHRPTRPSPAFPGEDTSGDAPTRRRPVWQGGPMTNTIVAADLVRSAAYTAFLYGHGGPVPGKTGVSISGAPWCTAHSAACTASSSRAVSPWPTSAIPPSDSDSTGRTAISREPCAPSSSYPRTEPTSSSTTLGKADPPPRSHDGMALGRRNHAAPIAAARAEFLAARDGQTVWPLSGIGDHAHS